MRDDFLYPHRKVIRFVDRIEVWGSFDTETWVVCFTMPICTFDAEMTKPRTALFKVADFYCATAETMEQPTAEVLRLFAESILTLAKTASNELIETLVDSLVCFLIDYISHETRDGLPEIKKRSAFNG